MNCIPLKSEYMIETAISIGPNKMMALVPHDFTKAQGRKMLKHLGFISFMIEQAIEDAPESFEVATEESFLQVA
jgi:hypothetical protein